ncbi:MAG TPA: hypothetical protein VMR08_01845, partial [Patescibacteria group bacterium]|nr:hypothetical protein [Patescibacteria group bacterium]
MNGMLFAASGTAALLLIGEWLWRKKITKGEIARKFVHITAATFAAFWPLFMNRNDIVILSLLFVAALVVIKKLHIFNSLHSVQRATYGEIWYAISIGVIALVFKDDVIYAIAILHLALADGFAAVIGAGLAKRARNFRFRGCRKSIAGTLTFLIISFALNLSYWAFATHYPINNSGIYLSPILYSLLSAALLAGTEISAPKGSDNVIVPLLAGGLLW